MNRQLRRAAAARARARIRWHGVQDLEATLDGLDVRGVAAEGLRVFADRIVARGLTRSWLVYVVRFDGATLVQTMNVGEIGPEPVSDLAMPAAELAGVAREILNRAELVGGCAAIYRDARSGAPTRAMVIEAPGARRWAVTAAGGCA